MNKVAIAAGVLALAGASQTFADTYNTEAAFLAVLQPNNYLEDFSNFTFGNPLNGSQATWAAPGANGYGWTASATGGLWSNTSALSTNQANQAITLTFTGNAVTAFGGIFTNTDINGNQIAGTVTVNLSNGEVHNFVSNPNSFFGWTGNSAILSISVLATSGILNNWAQIDHFYTGAAVPAPGALALVGLAGAFASRRRRA